MAKSALSGHCKNCGTWRRSLHRDHVLPKFKGGADDPSNIQLLCANCHEDKTREDLLGMPLSAAARRAQSRAQTGKKRSEQAKENIRIGVQRSCQTLEFREKMRQVALSRMPTPQKDEKRYHCNDCSKVTTAGPMKIHQRAKSHNGLRDEGALF